MFFTEHIQDPSIHTRVCRTHTTPITSEQQTYQEGVEPTHTLNVFSEGTYQEHVELYMTRLMSLVQTYWKHVESYMFQGLQAARAASF